MGNKKIRDALVKQGGLSRELANQITFGDDLIAQSLTVPLSHQKCSVTVNFKKRFSES